MDSSGRDRGTGRSNGLWRWRGRDGRRAGNAGGRGKGMREGGGRRHRGGAGPRSCRGGRPRSLAPRARFGGNPQVMSLGGAQLLFGGAQRLRQRGLVVLPRRLPGISATPSVPRHRSHVIRATSSVPRHQCHVIGPTSSVPRHRYHVTWPVVTASRNILDSCCSAATSASTSPTTIFNRSAS